MAANKRESFFIVVITTVPRLPRLSKVGRNQTAPVFKISALIRK
jgi:hypothetical protein